MTCNQDGKPCLSDAEAMNAKWEIAREIIRNENQLVTDRMTSFLTLQGFLFTALVFGSSALANDATRDYRWLLLIVLCAVCCLGFISPRLVSPGLRAAFRHIDATKEWWKSYLENCDDPRFVHAGRQHRSQRHGELRSETRSRSPIRVTQHVFKATSEPQMFLTLCDHQS